MNILVIREGEDRGKAAYDLTKFARLMKLETKYVR